MTYTTVYKDYPGDTLADAAAAMLLDTEIWRRENPDLTAEATGGWDVGGQIGYAIDHWEWGENRLRVWFR